MEVASGSAPILAPWHMYIQTEKGGKGGKQLKKVEKKKKKKKRGQGQYGGR
jgi:hypothetical protein